MTSTLERPAAGPRDGRRPRRTRADVVGTRPVAAVTAALWAAGLGLVVIGVLVTVVWAVSARGDDGILTPVAASGVVWLVAHHAAVDTGPAGVTLLPMLLLALPLLLLHRAGRWAARATATTDAGDAALIVVAATATYATLAFLVAQGASLGDGTVSPFAALGWTVVVAGVGLTAGVLDGAGLTPALVARLPAVVRRAGLVAATAGAALAVVVGVVAAAAVVARWSTETALSHQAAPGTGDALGLFLVSLAYLPNLLVWTLSYVAGPGFAVGGGVSVDAFSAPGALLPGVPILGTVPPDAPAAAPLLLLLPVLCGILASVVLRRRGHLELRAEVVALLGGAALVGLATVVLCALSRGSLGAGRLAVLGPPPWAAGLAVLGLVAAGAVLWSLLVRVAPTVWVRAEH
ncbi:MAG: DUF6350 family protein [Actinomycetales bacterium]|nr:DUF6350 family protein [Actinomycetales bacterium]